MNTSMPTVAASMAAEDQADFILKTYGHLMAGLFAFVLFEYWLFESGRVEALVMALTGVSWLLVLGAFVLVSYVASHVAHTVKSTGAQYAAFAALILAEGVIFAPLLYIASLRFPGAIENAAIVSLVGFSVLTGIVFSTRKNFTFLRPMLMWGFFVAMALIVVAVLFGISLGMWFSVAMIVYAGGAILYSTSNVLHEYGPGRQVAAAMELFASVALLFWYVLRLFMAFGED